MAGVESSSEWMKQMEEKLTCAICLEIYTDPVTLPCGHTLCKMCFQQWSESSPKSRWTCPLCQREDAIAAIQHLDVNVTLRNLCQQYKEYYEHGETFLDGLGTRSNSLVEPSNLRCKQHPDEEAKFVCMTCMEEFCGTCSALGKEHSDSSHEVVRNEKAVKCLTTSYKTTKQRLVSLNEKVKEKLNQTSHYIDHLLKTEENIRENCLELKLILTSFVDSLKLDYLLKVHKSRETSSVFLNELQLMYDEISKLSFLMDSEITCENVVDMAASYPALTDQTSRFEKNFNENYLNEIPRKHFKIELHQDIVKDVKTLVRKCYALIEKEHLDCTETRQLVGYFRLIDIRCPGVTKDIPIHLSSKFREFENYNLSNVGIVRTDMLVVDSKEKRILKIDCKSGQANVLYKYQGEICPVSVSTSVLDDKTYLAVTMVNKSVHVYTLETDQIKRGEDLNLPDNRNYVMDQNFAVALQSNLLCYAPSDHEIKIVSVSDRSLVFTLKMPSKLSSVYMGRYYNDTMLYVVDHKGTLKSFPVYNSRGERNFINYDTSICQSIDGMATNGRGILWVLDGKKLISFTTDGMVKQVLRTSAPWLGRICSLFISDEKIFLVYKGIMQCKVLYIPLPTDP